MKERREQRDYTEFDGRGCRTTRDSGGDIVIRRSRRRSDPRMPGTHVTTPHKSLPGWVDDWRFLVVGAVLTLLVCWILFYLLLVACGVDFVLALPGLLPVVLA